MAREPKKPAEDKAPTPKHSPRKVKSAFVDLEPTTHPLREDQSEMLDQLIRAGLGDLGRSSQFKRALQDPSSSVRDSQLRNLVAESLSRLIGLVLEDQNLFVRVRTILQREGRRHFAEGEDPILAALRLRTESRDPEANLKPNKTGIRRKHHPKKTESTGP